MMGTYTKEQILESFQINNRLVEMGEEIIFLASQLCDEYKHPIKYAHNGSIDYVFDVDEASIQFQMMDIYGDSYARLTLPIELFTSDNMEETLRKLLQKDQAEYDASLLKEAQEKEAKQKQHEAEQEKQRFQTYLKLKAKYEG